MKKSILMAALGLLSLNTIAQDTPKEEENETMPTLRYTLGDKNDFPLTQAVNFLTGKPVTTHADVLAAKKAKKTSQATSDKK